jgi:hypothetical protein
VLAGNVETYKDEEIPCYYVVWNNGDLYGIYVDSFMFGETSRGRRNNCKGIAL